MKRLGVERLRIRPRQRGGSRAGGGLALGLSCFLLRGFADDRRWVGVKVMLILALLVLVALLEVAR